MKNKMFNISSLLFLTLFSTLEANALCEPVGRKKVITGFFCKPGFITETAFPEQLEIDCCRCKNVEAYLKKHWEADACDPNNARLSKPNPTYRKRVEEIPQREPIKELPPVTNDGWEEPTVSKPTVVVPEVKKESSPEVIAPVEVPKEIKEEVKRNVLVTPSLLKTKNKISLKKNNFKLPEVKYTAPVFPKKKQDEYACHWEYTVPEIKKPKVDFLLVVDNSSSMKDEQDALKNNFKSFLNSINLDQLDLQIGVITTNSYKYNGNLFTRDLDKGEKWLQSDSSNFMNKFDQNAIVGIPLTREQKEKASASSPMLSILSSLSKAQLSSGYNKGFVRDGALLSIVTLSDADETFDGLSYKYDRSDYISEAKIRIQSLLSLLRNLKDGKGGFKLQVVGKTSESYAMETLAQQLNTSIVDIHGNFSSAIKNFGDLSIKEANQQIFSPELNIKELKGLEVKVDNQTIMNDSKNGYSLSDDLKSLQFFGNSSKVLKPGSKITVDCLEE